MRKGEFNIARKTFYWIFIGFFLTMVLIGFSLVLSGYKNRVTGLPDSLQTELIALRFTENPSCFAYQDPDTGRTFANVIDHAKWVPETMEHCYSPTSIHEFNFRLQLNSIGGDLRTAEYANSDRDDLTLRKEVLVIIGTELQKDTLLIYVQKI